MMRFDALALEICQTKEELLFCEICDPMGPRALGPNMAFLVGISRPHKRPLNPVYRFGPKNRKESLIATKHL